MYKFFKKVRKFMSFSAKKKFNYILNYFFFGLKINPGCVTRPVFLAIEPCNYCNLRCSSCPANKATRVKGIMSLADYKKIIDEVGDYLSLINLWNWGEPFLNPELAEMIKISRAKKIEVCVSTNGTQLSNQETIKEIIDSDLNRLIVSLDGLTQSSLATYRAGADWAAIVTGLKAVVDAKRELNKKRPLVEIQFLLMKHNVADLASIKQLARELGVDRLTFKTYNCFGDEVERKKYEPEQPVYSRYGKKLKPHSGCRNLWFGLNINYDGNAVPCCYDPYEENILGNVFKDGGVEKIWVGDRLAAFRKKILHNKKEIAICRECQYNENTKKEIKI